jgi:hypothetical protein
MSLCAGASEQAAGMPNHFVLAPTLAQASKLHEQRRRCKLSLTRCGTGGVCQIMASFDPCVAVVLEAQLESNTTCFIVLIAQTLPQKRCTHQPDVANRLSTRAMARAMMLLDNH